MKKCLLCVFLGIFILVISGIFVVRSIFANKSNQAECEVLIDKLEEIRRGFDKSCNINADCMDFAVPYSCSLCMNKNNDITEHNQYHTQGVAKDCFPAKECMPAECVCKNNICVKQRIEKDK